MSGADSPVFSVAELAELAQAVAVVHAAPSLEGSLAELCRAARALAGTRWASLVLRADVVTGSAPRAEAGERDVGAVSEDFALGVGRHELGRLTLSPAPTAHGRALVGAFLELAAHGLTSLGMRARLHEQDARLTLALDAASLGTWEHVPATQATLWDARSKAMFGFAADAAFDFEHYAQAIHPDDAAYVFANITKVLDPTGSGQCSMQYRIRTRAGEERWVEAHGRTTFDDAGTPLRVTGTLLDITTRKLAEEALRESNRRKDEFLAVLGHELRNPLAPIHTALALMRIHIPDQAVREREVIERQTRHMTRLVDDLLDLARIARGTITLKPEVLSVSALVARALEMTSPLFDARKQRVTVRDDEHLHVSGDELRLLQVVSNLLTNASRYTGEGGNIQVSVARSDEEVVITIRDDGVGIDTHELESIFEPFVQSRSNASRSGLGLGLSLVSDLVRLHKGRVDAQSAGLGTGSSFRVHLPITHAPRSDVPSVAPLAEPLRAQDILVVDDNEDAAEMLAALLTRGGHRVAVAHDGVGALAHVAEQRIHAAVVDLGLPVMDGFELGARLRERFGPALRLVALTGYASSSDRARTRAAGFDAHLVKPVDAAELTTALGAEVERKD